MLVNLSPKKWLVQSPTDSRAAQFDPAATRKSLGGHWIEVNLDIWEFLLMWFHPIVKHQY
jgi:hypothetical protein